MSHKSTSEIQTQGVSSKDYQEEGDLRAFRVGHWDEGWTYYMNAQQRYLYGKNSDRIRRLSHDQSEMWVVYDKQEPIIFIGVSPHSLLGSNSYVWTIAFREFHRGHIRWLKRMIERNLDRFDVLLASALPGRNRLVQFFGFAFSHYENGLEIHVRRT